MKATVLGREYEHWLREQRDTPARRWCLENPPRMTDVLRVVRRVEAQGFGLSRIALAA